MTTALARLIKEAPDIAREVMPASLSVEDVAVWVCHGEEAPIPAWFYSAVAGKLAEWLAMESVVVEGYNKSMFACYQIDESHKVQLINAHGTTFLDALVEAAIVVGREGR